jgi:hypothetical protein
MATSLLTGSRFTRRAFKPHFSIIDRGREFFSRLDIVRQISGTLPDPGVVRHAGQIRLMRVTTPVGNLP